MINQALELIQKKKCKEISWKLFLEEHNQISIFKITNPEEYKKNIKTYENIGYEFINANKNTKKFKKRLNTNLIANCFKAWNNADYLRLVISYQSRSGKGKKEYIYPKKLYNLNINFLFSFLEQEKNIELMTEEKNLLNYLFQAKPVRKMLFKLYGEDNLINAILKYYLINLYIPYLKSKYGLIKLRKMDKGLMEAYEIGNIIFQKNEGKTYNLTETKKLLLEYFFTLHENKKSKKLFDSLDNKMLKAFESTIF